MSKAQACDIVERIMSEFNDNHDEDDLEFRYTSSFVKPVIEDKALLAAWKRAQREEANSHKKYHPRYWIDKCSKKLRPKK